MPASYLKACCRQGAGSGADAIVSVTVFHSELNETQRLESHVGVAREDWPKVAQRSADQPKFVIND